ncbi:SpoIIE family protein phosphatase [Jatrophihabitans sp. YIM 134969]
MPVEALPPADRPAARAVHRFAATVRPAAAAPSSPTPSTTDGARRRYAAPELSVSGARDLVGRCLAGWGVEPEAIDDARLVVSELVTNAVRHDHATRVDVEVVDLGDRVSLVVEFDGTAGDGTAHPRLPSASATSGRGLAVVDRLADRWGRVAIEGGGRVWAVLGAPRTATGDPRVETRADDDRATAARRSASATELLVRLGPALAAARTPDDVARVLSTVTCTGLGAVAVRVSVVERDRRHLTTLSMTHGFGSPGATRHDLLDDGLPSCLVARRGNPLFLPTRTAVENAVPALASAPYAESVEAVAAVPLLVDGVTTGVVTVVWDEPHELGPDERATLTAIASFASVALQRATLAAEHRATADVLQATLLPHSLPDLEGIDIAAVYRPLGQAPDVGGDWYDAFVLPSGNLHLVIGDVAGHGTSAARTMGKIRYSARAYAVGGCGPAEVLARTNALLRHHGPDLLASMLCVEYDPVRRVAVVADAGHMPALAVATDGTARFLDGPVGPMLGATDAHGYATTTHVVAPGETVLLYTDGLVERRDVDLDDSLDDLATAAAEMRRFRVTADRLATALADRRAASDVVTDDVCVLAVAHR